MKICFLFVTLLILTHAGLGQDMKKFNLYQPKENAEQQLSLKIKEAKAAGKHVLIQVGGNWCIWCARFHDFVTTHHKLDSMQKASYVVYHLNYSPENQNKALLAKYKFPQRFGFPVFLILDGEGTLLHTQNSAYLEEGKGYSVEKVFEFFQHWSPAALQASTYN